MNPEPTNLNDLAAIARVTRSIRYRRALASAADEIERLRNDLDGSQLAYRGASYDRDRMRAEIERLRNELQECEKLLDEYQRADADRIRWENSND